MKCIVCGADTKVLASRQQQRHTHRRRECMNPSCKFRFSTNERAVGKVPIAPQLKEK